MAYSVFSRAGKYWYHRPTYLFIERETLESSNAVKDCIAVTQGLPESSANSCIRQLRKQVCFQ